MDGRQLSGGDGPGGEVLMVFLLGAITIGAFVSHLLSRIAPWLQYTPTLLVLGMLTSFIGQFTTDYPHLRLSFEAWEAIDGHMLLFVFLPPLLFADSMNLEWNLIRRCVGQCALLAGPGVVIGAVLNALFARYVLPYGWSWDFCLAYGAVQAATDPVAVVALLKSLGASPSLTMIISGAPRWSKARLRTQADDAPRVLSLARCPAHTCLDQAALSFPTHVHPFSRGTFCFTLRGVTAQ
jgi:hypothetical protein